MNKLEQNLSVKPFSNVFLYQWYQRDYLNRRILKVEARDNASFDEIILREFICMLEGFLCNEHKENCSNGTNWSVYNSPYWLLYISFKFRNENSAVYQYNIRLFNIFFVLSTSLHDSLLMLQPGRKKDANTLKLTTLYWVRTNKNICNFEQISY